MSPTVMRAGPYRLFFYSNEAGEPPHIHVQRDRLLAKFWLTPVSLARVMGFAPKELRKIEAIVRENEHRLVEAWHEYFAD